MLYWNANFQIPNSGVQSENVFAKIVEYTKSSKITRVKLVYYIDSNLTQEIKTEELEINIVDNINEDTIYDHLLTLEEFKQYNKA